MDSHIPLKPHPADLSIPAQHLLQSIRAELGPRRAARGRTPDVADALAPMFV